MTFVPRPERLAKGAGPSFVVIDFFPLSAAPRLGDVLAAHGGQADIVQIDPVADLVPAGSYMSLEELASRYLRALIEAGLPQRELTVVGYCSTAPLALTMAARLAEHHHPATILVFPSWPDRAMVTGELGRIRSRLGAAGSGPVIASAAPSALLAELTAILDQDVRAMADRNHLGTSNAVIDEMSARYRAWFSFLLASADTLPDASAFTSVADVIVDDAPPCWLPPDRRTTTLAFPDSRDGDAAKSLARRILGQAAAAQ